MFFDQSSVDWCEINHKPFFQEPYNTISALSFIYAAYTVNIKSYQSFIMKSLLYLIGITSILFHGSLLMIFQVLDQLSIFIFLFACILFFYEFQEKNVILVISVISFIFFPFMYLYPLINDFLLVIMGFIMSIVVIYSKKIDDILTKQKNHLIFLFLFSLLFWSLDRVCVYNIHLHWMFHCSIAYTAYCGIFFLENCKSENIKLLT